MKKIKGTGVALVTPFRKDRSVDFKSLQNLVEHVIKGGVDFLVVMGTTAEAVTLSANEKDAVLNYIIEKVNGELPIVLGLGGNNTQEVTDTLKNKDFTGVDAILSVAPYYNKPTQQGLYYHFKEISSASPVPIIIYNVPGRTSVNISAETTVKLAEEFDNIFAVKEASGNMEQIMQIVKNKPKDFTVLSGDDALTMPLITVGVEGVISVTANAYPKQFSEMVSAALENNIKKAKKIHYELLDFTNLIFFEGNPAGVKAALQKMEVISKYVRLPLVTASRSLCLKLEKFISNYK